MRRRIYDEQQPNITHACGKIRYRNRKLAEHAKVRSEARDGGWEGQGLRVYGCPECGGFHLTSQLTKRVAS